MFKMQMFFGVAVLLLVGVTAQQNTGAGMNFFHAVHNPSQPKTVAAIYVTAATAADKTAMVNLDVNFNIYEADLSMTFIDNRNGPVIFQTCHLMNWNEVVNNNNRIRSSCDMSRLDTVTPVGTDMNKRQWKFVETGLDFSVTGSVGACGLWSDGTYVMLAARCQRKDYIDSFLDIIYTAYFPKADIIVLTKSPDTLDVGNPPFKFIQRFFEVEFNIIENIQGPYGTYPPAAPTVDAPGAFLNRNNAVVKLGATIFFELIFKMMGLYQYYFPMGGFSPIAVTAHTCQIQYTYAPEVGAPPTGTVFIDDDGCQATGTAAMVMWFTLPNAGYLWSWFTNDNSLTDGMAQMISPNVMRTKQAELTIPSKVNAGLVDIKIVCKLRYCYSAADKHCFIKEGETEVDGRPACVGPAGRRKRQAEDTNEVPTPDSYPKTTTTHITLVNLEREIITADDIPQRGVDCFEKKTFFAVAIVLGIILLIVFAVSLAMFVKIRTYSSDDGSSVEGFHNKGYN